MLPPLLHPSIQFHLRSLLAAVMVLAPVAAVRAAQPAVRQHYLTPETMVAATLRPRQILTNPANGLLPVEIAKAFGEKYLGKDIAEITRVTAVVEPPLGTKLFYAVFLEAAEPWDLGKLHPDITTHTEPGEIQGRQCLVSRDPSAPSFMVLKGKILVAATQVMLEKLMAADRQPAESVLTELVGEHSAGDDLYVAVDLQGLRPMINIGLAQAASGMPVEYRPYLKIPNLLKSAELYATLDGSQATGLVAHCTTDSDADELESLLDQGIADLRASMQAEMQDNMDRLRSSDDPVEQAAAAYIDRVSGAYFEMFKPQRQGESFVLLDTSQQGSYQIGSVAVIGVLVALLLPAVQAAREAARRNQAMNTLKMIELALLNYEAAHKSYPPHAIYSDDGRPLLSWRVAILPYIEEQALYEQFHLDEPWDSEHNQRLIAQMPELFSSPSSGLPAGAGKSNYVVPIGEGFVFDGTASACGLRDITDGTSNTLNALEVADSHAVTWTQPVDWKYDEHQPTQGLTGLRPGIFLGGFCDGHVTAIAAQVDPTVLKAMLTRAGGEVADW